MCPSDTGRCETPTTPLQLPSTVGSGRNSRGVTVCAYERYLIYLGCSNFIVFYDLFKPVPRMPLQTVFVPCIRDPFNRSHYYSSSDLYPQDVRAIEQKLKRLNVFLKPPETTLYDSFFLFFFLFLKLRFAGKRSRIYKVYNMF